MARIDSDMVAWASQALSNGQSLEYIASVMEVKGKLAQKLILNHRVRQGSPNAKAELARERAERIFRHGHIPLRAAEEVEARRRVLLRQRYAKYWDAIWFQRSRGMRGKTLRAIYGDAALIWSVGGGIDIEI